MGRIELVVDFFCGRKLIGPESAIIKDFPVQI